MMLIVFTTIEISGAETLAEAIVNAKLAGCVQILPPMTSVYVWEGQVQKAQENLLLIKTLPEKYDELESFIIANHSYDVPEIFAVEATKTAEPYLAWLEQVIGVGRKI